MAGGCPLLLSYTTPGERLRGCTFAEGFKSYSDLVQNSESITGSPTVADGVCTLNGTSWIDYRRQAFSKDFTVQLAFKANGLLDGTYLSSNDLTSGIRFQQNALGMISIMFLANGVQGILRTAQDIGVNPTWYNDGNWHTLFLSVSRTAGTYTYVIDGVVKVNAGALAATTGPVGVDSTLRIGATTVSGAYPYTGQIKDVKIWDTALDVAEAQAYYNGTMYNYMSRVLLNYPMTAACHDAVNGQTLDIGPQQRHLVFRAGNAPTKDPTRRGYLFAAAGGNGMTSLARTPSTSTARTLFQILGSTAGTAESRCAGLLQADGTTLANAISNSPTSGQVFGLYYEAGGLSLTGLRGLAYGDSMLTSVYPSVGGASKYLVNFGPPLAISSDRRTSNDDRYVVVGRSQGGAWASYNAVVRTIMLWDEELNATQIYDLHARMAKQINDV